MLLIVLPYFGVFIYLISNSQGMAERRAKEVTQSQAQFDDYVRSVSGSGGGAATEIERAKQLLDSGAISQDEFEAIKREGTQLSLR